MVFVFRLCFNTVHETSVALSKWNLQFNYKCKISDDMCTFQLNLISETWNCAMTWLIALDDCLLVLILQ